MPTEKKRGVCMLLIAAMLFCMVGQSRVYVEAAEGAKSAIQIYEAEGYYTGNTAGDGATADMQPGESITITLGDEIDAGTYLLAVNSCGNRESFEISVNGESVGTITRTGTDFGMDQMTLDYLSESLELKSEDTVTIKAPDDGSYGWVDYLQLKKIPSYIYQAEDYYSGNISEDVAADMQPGESITIDLSDNEDFVAGTYALSVYSCGNRESFEVLVNDESVGTINREGTDFGQIYMTLDTLMVLNLSVEDTITIIAPDDGSYGWVDYLGLDAVSSNAANEYITFEGGSLRIDDESDTTSSLRFGYTITSAVDDAAISSWSWDLSYGSVSGTVTGEKYTDNGNSTYTSNVVITDIPEDYYTTEFNTLLTVVYTRSDGSTLTVIDDTTETRTVYQVATGVVGSTSETDDARAKAQQIIDAVNASAAE